MKKIISMTLALLALGIGQISFAATSDCPSAQLIQSLKIFNADPHDYDNLWDAETNNFDFAGHSWNVAVQNFVPEQPTDPIAMQSAQKLLQTTSLIQNPKKIRSPDGANNICIYAWNGSYGKDLLIIAYEY
jgi:hypothetical protein